MRPTSDLSAATMISQADQALSLLCQKTGTKSISDILFLAVRLVMEMAEFFNF